MEFKEGNAWWNCDNMCRCGYCSNPDKGCAHFKPLRHYISMQQIADWLGISRQSLYYILTNNGAKRLIRLLERKGHSVYCEKDDERIRFYKIASKT